MEVAKFRKKCEAASNAGQYEVQAFKTNHHGIAQPRKANLNLREAMLKQMVNAMGFPKCTVDIRKLATVAYFVIDASWQTVSRTEEPPKKKRKGHCATCKICEETKSLMALAPCGHTMCVDCRAKSAKQSECPFCRQHVVCATEGLFFS